MNKNSVNWGQYNTKHVIKHVTLKPFLKVGYFEIANHIILVGRKSSWRFPTDGVKSKYLTTLDAPLKRHT